MARWIERHRRPAEPSPWLREIVTQASGEGAALYELYLNLPLVLKALSREIDEETQETGEVLQDIEAEIWKVFKPVCEGLGPLVVTRHLARQPLGANDPPGHVA